MAEILRKTTEKMGGGKLFVLLLTHPVVKQLGVQTFWFVESLGKIPENSGTDVSTPSNETEWNRAEFDLFFSKKIGAW